jgi:putative transposase
VRIYKRYGQKAFEASFPAQERDRSCFRATQALCADGHKFDLICLWPDGAKARPCLVLWIDLFSGLPLAWRIDRTENLDAVRLSFGDALSYGIPAEVYLDNGRAFAAKWMSGRIKHRFRFKLMPEEPAGIFNLLGVKVHWTKPYHGQAKPIERFFGEVKGRITKHPAFAGAYLGANPKDAPEHRGQRVIPIAEFIKIVDQGIRALRVRAGRRSKNCAGRSFQETFDASYKIGPITKATEEQCRLCLLAVRNVRINQNDGAFNLYGNRYGDKQQSEDCTTQARGASPLLRGSWLRAVLIRGCCMRQCSFTA